MKLRITALSILCFFAFDQAIGQDILNDVITSSGGDFCSSLVTLNWSMGEPVIETIASNGNYLTQGFQQPSPVKVTAISNANDGPGISVYPNPVTTVLYIKHDNYKVVQFDLLDMSGKILLKSSLNVQENSIKLNDIAVGVYFLQVYDNNGILIGVLKVDKTK